MTPNRLKDLRKRAKLKGHQIAERLDVSPAQVSRWENMKDNIPSDRLPALAGAYQCSISEIFEEDEIQVVGYVGAGAKVYPYDDHAMGDGLYAIPRPPFVKGRAVAVRVVGDSMIPTAEDGWELVYSEEPTIFEEDFLNRLCVVKLDDESMLVKRVLRGTKRGHYHLHSTNAPLLEDVVIEWAAVVTAIIPR